VKNVRRLSRITERGVSLSVSHNGTEFCVSIILQVFQYSTVYVVILRACIPEDVRTYAKVSIFILQYLLSEVKVFYGKK